ncbi:MAG: MBL fold metallo-hydrolase [Candidatus Kariarchaeaceae archaeon]
MVKLYFLGTGNAFGHEGRLHSCYLIEGSKTILLDAGFSTFPALRGQNLDIRKIDVILISHLHPDHYMFLPQLALEDYYIIKREGKIPVYGPIGTKEKILDVTKVLYNEEVLDHINRIFQFFEFGENERFSIPGGVVETLPAQHSPEARMQIITIDDKTIGYTGDTAFVLSSFMRLLEADVVITEANSYSHQIPDHTSLIELQSLHIATNKRIYLSHVGNSVIEAVEKIKPPFYLSEDGLVITI